MAEAAPRILHLHSAFDLGGKEARAVRLMNIWGERARHVVVSAVPGALGARAALNEGVACAFPGEDAAPALHGRPDLRRYRQWARYMRGFDLVLSYNWGSMDGVMAHRLFSPFLRLPRLVHHEDGFNQDERLRLDPRRNMFRRVALARAFALVVPSERLHDIARTAWHQPEARIRMIPNGIDVDTYGAPPAPDAIPGFVRTPGKLVVGTLAGLRAVKNLPLLVRAIAPLRDKVQLVIVGEGPEREAILAAARDAGVTDICLPGFLARPAGYVGLFDIFALSSDSEQFPISLAEAMSAGLPVVATRVGDVRAMVAPENRPFIVPPGDAAALTEALGRLVGSPDLRRELGAANQRRARHCFREQDMVERYAALYEAAMRRPGALGGCAGQGCSPPG